MIFVKSSGNEVIDNIPRRRVNGGGQRCTVRSCYVNSESSWRREIGCFSRGSGVVNALRRRFLIAVILVIMVAFFVLVLVLIRSRARIFFAVISFFVFQHWQYPELLLLAKTIIHQFLGLSSAIIVMKYGARFVFPKFVENTADYRPD